METPVHSAEANKISSISEFSIQGDGAIVGWEKTIANGQADMYLKMLYRLISADQRKKSTESSLNQRYPGVIVNEISVSDLYDLDKPVEIKVDFSCPDYAQKLGNLLVFPVPSEDFSSYATLVSDHGTRDYDFQIDYNMVVERELRLLIPDGYEAITLPESVSIKHDFGTFSRDYKVADGKTIEYSAMMSINSRNISKSEYPNVKKLIETASREDRGQIILKRAE